MDKTKITMAQQTALEWFFENIDNEILKSEYYYMYQRAKQMEKDQIVNTYLDACKALTPYGYYKNSAEQYYNEKYETT